MVCNNVKWWEYCLSTMLSTRLYIAVMNVLHNILKTQRCWCRSRLLSLYHEGPTYTTIKLIYSNTSLYVYVSCACISYKDFLLISFALHSQMCIANEFYVNFSNHKLEQDAWQKILEFKLWKNERFPWKCYQSKKNIKVHFLVFVYQKCANK